MSPVDVWAVEGGSQAICTACGWYGERHAHVTAAYDDADSHQRQYHGGAA